MHEYKRKAYHNPTMKWRKDRYVLVPRQQIDYIQVLVVQISRTTIEDICPALAIQKRNGERLATMMPKRTVVQL